MREACNLKQEVQMSDGPGETGRRLGDDGRRLRELSDALAALSIEQNAEAQEKPASINTLWELLAYPHAAASPKGGNVASEYFARMVSTRLWLPRGKTYNGIAIYCPNLDYDGDVGALYGEEFDVGEPTLPEVANMAALERYTGSVARWDNSLILRDFYKTPMAKRKEGRPTKKLQEAPRNWVSQREDYVRPNTSYMCHIRGMPNADGGIVKYGTTYGMSSSGYAGRL